MFNSKVLPFLIAFLAFIVFVLHITIFGNYIIDDAGILFAYARNIANGYGIVAQPGLTPVEGCSDFLWLILFVPFFWINNLFDPALTPKIFSAIIIFTLYLFFAYRLRKELPDLLVLLFLLFLSISTHFAIWNSSGLENPLYVILISLLFYYTYQILVRSDRKLYIIIGVLTFLIAITRPDGVLYFFVPLSVFTISFFLNTKEKLPWLFIFIYCSIFTICFGLFLLFRHSYFGEWVPNTYFFKGGPKLEDVWNIIVLKQSVILKLENLFSAVVGKYSFLIIFILLLTNCWIYFTKRFNTFHLTITLFFIFSILNFLLLPYDWMEEFRFATPFTVFFFLFLISTLFLVYKTTRFPLLLTSLTLIALSFPLGKDFYSRSKQFAQSPTVPFEYVAKANGLKFNNYAEALGIKKASLLTPDCGGTLFYSKLRVYDMAGLVDKRYAVATLGKNNEALHNLVFEVDKPTFIEIHSDWSYHIKLYEDPRLYRDYVAIKESEYNLYGRDIKGGEYVRRDAINNDLGKLKNLKIE